MPDGWGSVYAIDVSTGRKGVIKWKMDPGIDRGFGPYADKRDSVG
jgi:hypothetical protein